MENAGAFSGVFDELISSYVTMAKSLADSGNYSLAFDTLVEARKQILDSGIEYNQD